MADYLPQSDGLGSALQSYFSTTGASTSARTSARTTDSANEASRALMDTPHVVAVVEGKRSLESMIGIASIDTLAQEIKLFQTRDPVDYSITKEYIRQLDAHYILYPGLERKNYLNANPNEIATNTIVEPLDIQFFDEAKGKQGLKEFCKEFRIQDLGYSSTLAIVAASACFHYFITILKLNFVPRSLNLIVPNKQSGLIMDSTTVKVLELLYSSDTGDAKKSLFWLLNRTYTRRGMRLLRSNLLQPPSDLPLIKKRQAAIQELLEDEKAMQELADALSAFSSIDLDYTLKTIIVKSKTVSAMKTSCYLDSLVDVAVYLRTVLSHVDTLLKAMQNLHSPFFQTVYSEISKEDVTYDYLKSRICKFISDSCTLTKGGVNFKTTKLLAISKDADPFLPIKMKTYCELLEDMSNLANAYAEEYNRDIRLNYASTRGYHFVISRCADETEERLPGVFRCVQKKAKQFTATTESLIQKEASFRRVEADIIKLAGEAVIKLMDELSKHAAPIANLFESIGNIDLIYALAVVAKEHNFVCPNFDDYMHAKDAINPLLFLTKLDSAAQPVSNFIPKLSKKDVNMLLLTGPNQSGKSCYISGIAQLQIMAQIGSYVPVEKGGYVILPLVDQIFTRMGIDDDYSSNTSSFYREVNQISYIIDKATDSSLVIIDELGRGTSVEEGVALCFAVAEKLLKTRCLTFFASHFHDLIKLESLYPNIICYKMNHTKEIVEDDPESPNKVILKFTHKIEPMGDEAFTEYGIDIAAQAGIPAEIISSARAMLPQIQVIAAGISKESRLKREQFKLVQAISKCAEANWDNKKDQICQFVSGAKQQYLTRKKDIEETPSPGIFSP